MKLQEILDETKFLLSLSNDENNTIYKVKDFVRHANLALDEVLHIIFSVDQNWTFDDKNNTDLPIAVTDLEKHQRGYVFHDDFLKVDRVEIKDENDNWYKLEPINLDDTDISFEELSKNFGKPKYYREVGNKLLIFPISDYSQEKSIKVYFQRKMKKFDSENMEYEPGFQKDFHDYISLYCAYRYTLPVPDMTNQMKSFQNKLEELKQSLKENYKTKSEPEKVTLGFQKLNAK